MKSHKREMEAVVVSNKMQKTVVVEIKKLVRHAAFKKYHTQTKTYKAHDEKGECKVGDKVLLRESKPISKDKRWVVIQILESAVVA